MVISRQFSYTQNEVLKEVVDELGSLIELAFPFSNMKDKGKYSPRKVIRAAAEYSTPLVVKGGLSLEQATEFNYVYMRYRAAERVSISSMALDAATEDQLEQLRTYIRSKLALRQGLRVMDHGGRSFPEILMIFVALLYMRDALRPVRLKQDYDREMRGKTGGQRNWIKEKARRLNAKGE